MNKENLQSLLFAKLDAERIQQTKAAQLSRDEATSEESRAENKYDTRGQEAAYLAEGQARLASELQAACTILQNFRFEDFSPEACVGLGALVLTKQEGGKTYSWYLLSPVAGGAELEIDRVKIFVVTAASPVGRALLGSRKGDRLTVGEQSRRKTMEIISVA